MGKLLLNAIKYCFQLYYIIDNMWFLWHILSLRETECKTSRIESKNE